MRSLIVASATLAVVLSVLGARWVEGTPSSDRADSSIAGQSATPTPIPCTNGPCRMSLVGIVAAGVGTCDATEAKCTINSDGTFTLAVELVSVPAPGYILAQSYIDFGNNLIYDETVLTAAEEIVWPECEEGLALRTRLDATLPQPSTSSKVVTHSCLTGLVPPLIASSYDGPFVEMSLACSTSETTSEIWLRPFGHPMAQGSGALYISAGDSEVQGDFNVIPEIDHLTVNCLAGQTGTATPTLTMGPSATATPTVTVIDTPAPSVTSTPDVVVPPTTTPDATVTATAPTLMSTPTPTAVQTGTPLPTFIRTPAPQEAGDVNCDGRVDPLDAALILQLAAGLILSLPCPNGADVSGDGAVDALDAVLILQFSAGLIDALPV